MSEKWKPLLCLDFDGVIHSYDSGWQGADIVADGPVSGAMEFIRNASEDFFIAIYSSRSSQTGGIAAMKSALSGWMIKEFEDGQKTREILDDIRWPVEKPPAFLTIDDRAIQFKGKWPYPSILLAFKPWNKRGDGDGRDKMMSYLSTLYIVLNTSFGGTKFGDFSVDDGLSALEWAIGELS